MSTKNYGNKGLSLKEEAFAQARFAGLSSVEAALRAGFSPGNRKGAGVQAARLNARQHVKDRIAELIGSVRVEDDRSRHIDELILLREMAKSRGHTAVAVRSQELLGRVLGVGGDDQTVNMTVHQALADVSSDELRAALAEAIGQNGNLAEIIGGLPATFKHSELPNPDDEPKPAAGEAVH